MRPRWRQTRRCSPLLAALFCGLLCGCLRAGFGVASGGARVAIVGFFTEQIDCAGAPILGAWSAFVATFAL